MRVLYLLEYLNIFSENPGKSRKIPENPGKFLK